MPAPRGLVELALGVDLGQLLREHLPGLALACGQRLLERTLHAPTRGPAPTSWRRRAPPRSTECSWCEALCLGHRPFDAAPAAQTGGGRHS